MILYPFTHTYTFVIQNILLKKIFLISAGFLLLTVGISHGETFDNPYKTVVTSWGSLKIIDYPVKKIISFGNSNIALQQDGKIVNWGQLKYNHWASLGPYYGQLRSNDLYADVARGPYHTIALREDSTVVGWGINDQGQINNSYLTGVVAIAAGISHSLALKNDGTVVAWGQHRQGQIDVPADLNEVVSIVADGSCSIAIKSNGTAVKWGSCSLNLSELETYSNIEKISSNGYHGDQVFLFTDGSIKVFGAGVFDYGLGNTPPDNDYIDIALGRYHGLALKKDSTVVSWGVELGDVNPDDKDYGQAHVPNGLKNVIAISAGYFHSVALKSDGTLVTWGKNDFGQATVPSGRLNVDKVFSHEDYSLFLHNDGTLSGIGFNEHGPTDIPNDLTDVVDLALDDWYVIALKGDSSITYWGGAGGLSEKLDNWKKVVKLDEGDDLIAALMADGTFDFLGMGASLFLEVPEGAPPLKDISISRNLILGITTDDKLFFYPDTIYPTKYESPPESWFDSTIVKVTVANGYSAILTSNGAALSNNKNSYNNSWHTDYNIKNIEAMGGQLMLHKKDGTLILAGRGTHHQGLPDQIENVDKFWLAIGHIVLKKRDSVYESWYQDFSNLYGSQNHIFEEAKATLPENLNNVMAFSGGPNHTVALFSEPINVEYVEESIDTITSTDSSVENDSSTGSSSMSQNPFPGDTDSHENYITDSISTDTTINNPNTADISSLYTEIIPFDFSTGSIVLPNILINRANMSIYNVLGELQFKTRITSEVVNIPTQDFRGVYVWSINFQGSTIYGNFHILPSH